MDITTQVDILVVGGGTAGTIAALQAARIGAKTFVVERGSQLGGTMTTGGVAFPGLFDAWGKTTPLNVPLSELKDLLRKHAAIVPAR